MTFDFSEFGIRLLFAFYDIPFQTGWKFEFEEKEEFLLFGRYLVSHKVLSIYAQNTNTSGKTPQGRWNFECYA